MPGWAARGHAGYIGYAWYRIHVTATAPLGETQALIGPFAVDSAYEAYFNGEFLGGLGDFTGKTPAAYSSHQPRFFALPPSLAGSGQAVLALRVWAGPWTAGDPEAGGIHIAPLLGGYPSVHERYRLQWLELFEGYVVDAVEGLMFVLLAVMALSLRPFDPRDRAYVWLASALILLGVQRANQMFFFLGRWESLHAFEFIIIVLIVPLSLGAWIMAWRAWLQVQSPAWLPEAVVLIDIVYLVAQFLSRSWFYGSFPHVVGTILHDTIACARLLLLSSLALIVYQATRQRGHEAWYALTPVLAVGVGLFAQELSAVHVPGIWFPFGVGVSRTEYAYAALDVLLFALLLRRLWSYAQPLRTNLGRLHLETCK